MTRERFEQILFAHVSDEVVQDMLNEYVLELESSNAKLRELVKRYHHLVTGTDELWSWQSVYEQLHELGIEVPDA